MLKNFVLAFVLTISMQMARTNPFATKQPLDLVIFHNNDIHARFEQTDKLSIKCHPEEMIANKCYGGFARVSQVLKEYRKKAKTRGSSVLYLNAGDTYTGTPWFTIFKDRIVSDFMNVLQTDAMSLGNHELDLGVDGLVPLLNEVKFPVLIANLNISADHKLWQTRALKKSVVFDIKGIKVGLIGYLTPDTKFLATPNNLEFIPEVIAINAEAKTLQDNGVNIIIALGHSGYEMDKEIAKNCPLVDLVIGGHTNTFLYSGKQPDIEQIDGPYPTIIRQDSGKRVPVVQAYAYTKYLGKLKLSFDENGNLEQWKMNGAPILLDYKIPQDPEVLDLLEKYRPSVLKMTKTIGYTKVHLDVDSCYRHECNLGNMIADALIYTRVKQHNGTHWTDAAISLVQAAAMRSSTKIGEITEFDLKTILPFNNSMLVVRITGEIILKVLEHSMKQYVRDSSKFLHMSGMRVTYNLKKEPGHRVQSVDVLCTDCDIPAYSKLEINQTYGVILSDYLYNGGDGYSMLKGLKYEYMGIYKFDAVRQYIKDRETVYPMEEGRVTLLNSGGTRFTVTMSIVFLTIAILNNQLL